LKTSSGFNLHVALIHYPVINKHGDTVASAVTNLDLHDIARAARTFGVQSFHVITPLDDQRALAQRIVRHWTHGHGREHHPKRRAALELIQVTSCLDETRTIIGAQHGQPPTIVATCARRQAKAIGFGQLARQLRAGAPHLVIFGTAWGLAPEMLAAADNILEPIGNHQGYNHLSVRCAAAIVLDRLMTHRP
jgi:hypothetical protein